MKILVTGGAGFIGSHLCQRLINEGHEVFCVDNFWLGNRRNIADLINCKKFHFEEIDLLDYDKMKLLFNANDFDFVFHLAANSDVKAGLSDPGLDKRLNFETTFNLLKLMGGRKNKLIFASTSAVFGELSGSIGELAGPLQPISFYGASKLAAESYISVYSKTLGLHSTILRFPNVVGEHATHGIIFDLLNKLAKGGNFLEVLGDGSQKKPYLYVHDLINAMLIATKYNSKEVFDVFNVSGEGATTVKNIAEMLLDKCKLPNINIKYTGGDRGWPGDVPNFQYDTQKIRALGWVPALNSDEAIEVAIDQIIKLGF